MSIFDRMLRELPFSASELKYLIATAQYRYKVYKIPKRQSNQFRTIAQPSPEIKLLQRWLMSDILSTFPINKAATAYREGRSIADHASLHAKKKFLLKMDFKNFFPSISAEDVHRYLIEYRKVSPEDTRLIGLLVCWRNKTDGKLCLSIGAPSSPLLSNAMLYTFDKVVTKLCRDQKVTYSRYADDLAFSTNKKEVLSVITTNIYDICNNLVYPRLVINEQKTVSISRSYRRVLVGLVLTPTGKVSLGREKKRRLRSELYRFSQGRLNLADVPKLRGELAFAWSVESDFIFTLLRQFSEGVFRQLDLPFSLPNEIN
ncbi:RNA-directed DNA polymerase [Candidatus Nitrotoga sp. HW29]|uniref:retron St85 family RNA-directed DNA polymerase n=1 Tax=Candidatus Nitrotoga sp. HW29 TaxID=2886963 RepID=UPI001EF2FC25|nr:retron St85 family RNA-directed DNA polymerase [Candidatus Nitrotoga sp. HW29]CAH1905832.1 RNA-directed DNA polymerase [Candidatus Nitrotoga sp. HW29]